jgi:hypothetical protein
MVLVAKFELMKAYFVITSEELRQQYQITAVPTVILFVRGREQQRWVMEYDLDEYRRGLNSALRAEALARAKEDNKASVARTPAVMRR